MKVPAVLLRHPLGEESQRAACAIHHAGARHPSALGRDAHAREAEADRRDAADVTSGRARRLSVGPRPIPDDAGAGVRLLPEEHERSSGQVLQKRIVRARERVLLGRSCRRLRRGRLPCDKVEHTSKDATAVGHARSCENGVTLS